VVFSRSHIIYLEPSLNQTFAFFGILTYLASMQVARGVEVVRYVDKGDGDLQVQLAVNGILAPMIDDHKSTRDRYRSDEEYFTYIARQSELLIHLYGDARNPFPMDLIQGRQEEGF
jgi:hypothetical protein